jgi:hypothetical protein
LAVLAVDDVALPVEEPAGDLVLRGVLHDGDDALEFFRGEFTGAVVSVSALPFLAPKRRASVWKCIPLVEVDIRLLADQVAVASADALDLGQGVHDLLLACCPPLALPSIS